jgi:hypothetical protein
MTMTLKQFRAYLAEQPIERCSKCGAPLEAGKSCEDCYFRVMGEELDKHPIFIPRVRNEKHRK